MGQALGCVQVDQSTVAVKEHFGRFDAVLEPGCHCLPWCFGYQVAGQLSLRVQQLDVRCETKTKVCSLIIIIIIIFLEQLNLSVNQSPFFHFYMFISWKITFAKLLYS